MDCITNEFGDCINQNCAFHRASFTSATEGERDADIEAKFWELYPSMKFDSSDRPRLALKIWKEAIQWARATAGVGAESFQSRVRPWLIECFGAEVAGNKIERNHRFIEECLELVQALGCSR